MLYIFYFLMFCATRNPFYVGFMSSYKLCENIYLDFIWRIMIRSGHNVAHATAAVLPWHVQNCDLIRSLKSKLEPKIFSQDFSIWALYEVCHRWGVSPGVQEVAWVACTPHPLLCCHSMGVCHPYKSTAWDTMAWTVRYTGGEPQTQIGLPQI